MKKSTKVLLGIATVWPILYMFLFMASILLLFAFNAGPPVSAPQNPGSPLLPLGVMGLFAVHLLTILGTLALTVFYVIRVFKTERLDQNLKIMWMLLLFFAGTLAQPVFWYLYIWRGTPDTTSQKPPQLGAGLQSPWRSQTAAPEPEAAYVPPSEPPDWR
jgi:hypothetical protein